MIPAREVGRGDRPGVIDLLRAAFDGDGEARLVERLWADNLIVAERLIEGDARIIAYAAVSPVVISMGGDAIKDALGLAPVAVAPKRQRQGHGETVVDAVINAAFERFPRRLLFVLGDHPYYQRFGFLPAGPFGYRWEGGDVGDAFQVQSSDGGPRPVAPFVYSSYEPQRAIVHYNDAFNIFDEAAE